MNKIKRKKSIQHGIRLLALGEMEAADNGPAYRYIEFQNTDSIMLRDLIRSTDVINLRMLKSFLIDRGYPLETEPAHWKLIQRTLSKSTPNRVLICKLPGFKGNVYLCADGTIIGKKEKGEFPPLLHPDINCAPIERSAGTLESWQKHVASHALHSSRLMLGVCSSFAGILIRFSNVENGGFHFWAESSIGKSTAQLFAASVCGDSEYVKSWKSTESGLEDTASAHDGSILLLNEIKGLSENNPRKTAALAENLIYMLAEGYGKTRDKTYQTDTRKWRLVFLSSGELSLHEQATEGGRTRMPGAQVRAVDIPADAGEGMGIYESLPQDTTPGKFSDLLKDNCAIHCGTAKPAFLKRLVRGIDKDQDMVKARIAKSIQIFLNKHDIDSTEGQQHRITKRFALVYAAGVFAVNYKILPFSRDEMMKGISTCYRAAIESQPSSMSDKVNDSLKLLRKELKSSGALDIREKDHGHQFDELMAATRYKAKFKGNKIIALTRNRLKNLVPNDNTRTSLLKRCQSGGALIPDGSGKSTIQLPSGIKDKRLPRCHCFIIRRLNIV